MPKDLAEQRWITSTERHPRGGLPRALASSSTGGPRCARTSASGQSAWPGRGQVSGRSWPAVQRSLYTGTGDMTVSHFGHSVFAILIAIPGASVRVAGRRGELDLSVELHPRARGVAGTACGPARRPRLPWYFHPRGYPSQIGAARPCDSPAVSKRKHGHAPIGG